MKPLSSIYFLVLTVSALAQENALSVETYELNNGLKIYLNEDKTASNIYGAVWVNAGGKNDPADATGIAHYLEHMLFKGTQELGTMNYQKEQPHLEAIKGLYDQLATEPDEAKKVAIQKKINEEERKASEFAIPNEFDRLLKSFGSTGVNASTNNDYTNYYNYFPPNQLPKWLDIYAHRFQKPVFRLFQSELEAVYEEKNRAGDDLERRVGEKFNEYIYGDHPYSTQTVLGSVAHLKNPSLKKMYDFFQTYYVPNNMALVLSGNFDSDSARSLIAATFGKLQPGKQPIFKTYDTNSFEGRVLEKVRITPIKAAFMGYKLVPYGHQDRAALEVIGDMMSNSSETGFIDQLSLDNEVLYAGAFQEFMEEDGSTFIFYVPKLFGKSLNYFEEKIKSGFQDIANGAFEDAYLQAIKNGIYRRFNRSLEGLGARGRYLGLSFIYDIDYQEMLSYPNKIQQLSKADIQKAAATYYGADYFTMRSRTGFPKRTKLKKPPYEPITARTKETSAYAKKFEQLPEDELDPNFIDVNNDINVYDDYLYYTKNPLNDVFTLRLEIAKGQNNDKYYPVLANALNNSGTSTYSVKELKTAFANLGTTFSCSAGYTTFTFNLTGIDKNFQASLALLEDILTEFSPTAKTVNYLYNQRKTNNKLDKNNPASAGRTLYAYGLFGNLSASKNRVSTKTLKKITPALLASKLETLLENGFSSIHYVGQNPFDESIGLLQAKELFKRNDTDTYQFMQANEVKENTIYLVHDKKAIQSYAYYIVNGGPLNRDDDYKKEAFNRYYTNSLSGLLFQEVREFRSLAYATAGAYIDPDYEPQKRGRLVLFTGSQADKTTDAVGVVLGLISAMPTYENRLEGIKNGLLLESASKKPSFRSISTVAHRFMKTGYTKDPNELNYQKFDELSFSDIESFYSAQIKGKPVTLTIYGDTSEFDRGALSKFGKIIDLTLQDIRTE